jgi:signal peptidase I
MAKLSPAIRDILVLIVVFGLLIGGLYAYTATWPPAVIVESGSMMHADNEVTYGRLGTIDPGDLVLVKNVTTPDDVMTLVENGTHRYGKPGDVIVYFPADNRLPGHTPIIHRAVAYVVVEGSGSNATYYVRWSDQDPCVGGAVKVTDLSLEGSAKHSWCQYDSKGVLVPDVPIAQLGSSASNPRPYVPVRTGFLTKGDNPATNTQTDQLSGLSRDERGVSSPVQMSWIEGKARGELPWLGLIKLAVSSRVNEPNAPAAWVRVGNAYAPKDLWVMLAVSLFVLVGVPLIYDGYKAVQLRRGKGGGGPMAPEDVAGAGTGPNDVLLTWRPPATGPPPASYHVYRGATRVGTTSEPRFAESGLQPGVSYLYAVSAVDANGVEGPKCPLVSVATAPPAPATSG